MLARLRGRTAWCLAVAALTALVFARSLGAEFLDLDDLAFVVNNAHFRGLTMEHLRWMFGFNWILWFPLTWLSYALDHALWGSSPWGYHLTNVLLHALNAALAFRAFEALMEKGGAGTAARRPAAALGALLFALHPLRVESVTWVSERSDVLAASFGLGTLLAWLEGGSGVALALHALGLAAKATTMPVPLALGLLDALGLTGRPWPGARREAARLAPMLALSAAAGAVGAAAQARVGAARGLGELGAGSRLSIAAWNYLHGPWKTLWPFGLRALDPLPRVFDGAEPRFLAAGALVAAVTALAWRARRRAPAAAAWGAYLLMLAPTAGFLKVGNHLTADRYTYLSTLGFAALAAAGARRALAGPRRPAAAAASVLLGAVLAASTWARQGDWRDPESFWGALARDDARNATARMMLARRYQKDGRVALAEPLLREAVAIDPGDGGPHNALANLLASQGRLAEAEASYRAAIAAAPEHPIARYNLARVLIRLGRRDEAAAALREELALIRRAPTDALRRELGIDPDEGRTAALLDELTRRTR